MSTTGKSQETRCSTEEEDPAILLFRGYCELPTSQSVARRLKSVLDAVDSFFLWSEGRHVCRIPAEAEGSPEGIAASSIINNKDVVFASELIACGDKLIDDENDKINLYLTVLEFTSVFAFEKLPPGAWELRNELGVLLYGVETHAIHKWRKSTDLETSEKWLRRVVKECQLMGADKLKQFETILLRRELRTRKSWIEPYLIQLLGCMDKGATKETSLTHWMKMLDPVTNTLPEYVLTNTGNSLEATFLCGWISLLQLQSAFVLLKEYSASANMDSGSWKRMHAKIFSSVFMGMGEDKKMKESRLQKLQSHQELHQSPSTRPSKRACIASSEFELPQFLLEEFDLPTCNLMTYDACLRDYIIRCVAQRAINNVNFRHCMEIPELKMDCLVAFLRPFVEEGAINLLDHITPIFVFIIDAYVTSVEESLLHLIRHIATFHDHQFLEGRREKRPLHDLYKNKENETISSSIVSSRHTLDAKANYILTIPVDQVLLFHLSYLSPKNHPNLALPVEVIRSHIIGIPSFKDLPDEFFLPKNEESPDNETQSTGFLWSSPTE